MQTNLQGHGRFLVIAVIAVWAMAVLPAGALAATEDAPPPPAVLDLQLDWFMMPVTATSSKRVRTVPGTIFLRAKTESDVAPICVFEPRIRDALLQVLFARPIVINKGRLEAKDLYPALIEAANSVMKEARVTDIWVQAGIARADRGSLESLPFDSVQKCRDVRENEQKLLEQKNKAH